MSTLLLAGNPIVTPPSFVKDLPTWVRALLRQTDGANRLIVDMTVPAGIIIARDIAVRRTTSYQVVVDPDTQFAPRSDEQRALDNADAVHRMDLEDLDERRRLLQMADLVTIMPDIDKTILMIQKTNHPETVGREFKVVDYDSLGMDPVPTSEALARLDQS